MGPYATGLCGSPAQRTDLRISERNSTKYPRGEREIGMASRPDACWAKVSARSMSEPMRSVANTRPAAVPLSARTMRRKSSVGGVTPEKA